MSLKRGDLKDTVEPIISIDNFHPKAGSEQDIIVVSFYFKDQEPANDLNTFIQRGFIDTLDVDVSPNTDEDGLYLLFVELKRDSKFMEKFSHLVRDIENLTGHVDWRVQVHGQDKMYQLTDPVFPATIITDPDEYLARRRRANNISEAVNHMFSNSLVHTVACTGNIVTIKGHGTIIRAVIEDIGEHEQVMGRNFLSESAITMHNVPAEVRALQVMTGNLQITPIQGYICVSGGGSSMLLSDAEIVY